MDDASTLCLTSVASTTQGDVCYWLAAFGNSAGASQLEDPALGVVGSGFILLDPARSDIGEAFQICLAHLESRIIRELMSSETARALVELRGSV